MATTINADACSGCGSCTDACPVEAIAVDDVATINAELCTECGACADQCPMDAITTGA